MKTAKPRLPLRAWHVVAGLVAIIALTQLLTFWLGARRPVEPAALFTSTSALADPRAPTLGAADANVVIYLFSDYACGNCRVLHPALRTLVAEDGGVRLVHRDWAILGPRSTRAAHLALASVAQGRHPAFDDALMRRGGSLDEAALRAAAASVGIDWRQIEGDAAQLAVTQLLDDTDRLARGVGFVGTPVLVVGPYLVQGRISLDQLRDLVRDARRLAAAQGRR